MAPFSLASTIRETVPRTGMLRAEAQLRAARSSMIASAPDMQRQSVRTWVSPSPRSHDATSGSMRSTAVSTWTPGPSTHPLAASEAEPARSSTATPSGTTSRALRRWSKSILPIFPSSIKGDALTTQTSPTVHLGLKLLLGRLHRRHAKTAKRIHEFLSGDPSDFRTFGLR